MKIIKVKLKKRAYDIVAGKGAIRALGRLLIHLDAGRDAYVISNTLVKKKFGAVLTEKLESSGFTVRFKCVPDSEESKSFDVAFSVIKDMARYDRGRRLLVIALGGGVVGDLAGFIASVYKRGVPLVQIPTTFLAQIDSSIGGKTGLDLAQGKNLVGAFYQPKLVLSDVAFLRSLSTRQMRAGLAEAIKYGIIRDRNLFVYLEKRFKDVLAGKPAVLEHVVSCCSRIKADIVAKDEKEKRGIRTVLNFGHTIGHAIEAACRFKAYNHGEAVGLGMLVASDISLAMGLLDRQTAGRIEKLIANAGLPVKIRNVPLARVISAHYHDKKFIGRKNRFVLTAGIGRTKILENIPPEIIRQAILKRM